MAGELAREPRARPITAEAGAAVVRLRDKERILSFIKKKRLYCASAYGQIEPSYFERAEWYVTEENDNYALCLRGQIMQTDALVTMGNPEGVSAILHSLCRPKYLYITCEAHHKETIRPFYGTEYLQDMLRMVVDRQSFVPLSSEGAERLGPGHVYDLNRLYREDGPSFSLHHIAEGVYYGIWREGRLVAVAGTHTISRTYGIATVGNVLTHPRFRDRGFATECTGAVTAELLKTCQDVVLNVDPGNTPAIRAYAKLGYKPYCRLYEGLAYRQGGSLLGGLVAAFERGIRSVLPK